jgi:hypothetical protein
MLRRAASINRVKAAKPETAGIERDMICFLKGRG